SATNRNRHRRPAPAPGHRSGTSAAWSTSAPPNAPLPPSAATAGQAACHTTRSGGPASRRVFQVVKVNPDLAPAARARELAEPIQGGGFRPVAVPPGTRDRLAAQRRLEGAFAAVARRVVDQRPVVDLLRDKDRPRAALDAHVRRVLAVALDLAPRGEGGRIGGQKIVPDLGPPADLDADEMAGLGGGVLLVGAVEPAQVGDRVLPPDLEHDLAAGLQPVRQGEGADAVGVVAVGSRPPELPAHLARGSPGEVRILTEAEVVRPPCSRS